VDLPLDSIKCDWVVSCVWGEDGNCITWGEGIDGGFVGLGISDIVCGVGFKRSVEAVVELRNILMKMLTCEC
jgi:hypothetical protein